MGGSFETRDDAPDPRLRPFRVAVGREDVYREVQEMVDDLPGWTRVRDDEAHLTVVAERKGGLFSGTSRITIRVEGPDGLPSAAVHLSSQTEGGLPGRDRKNCLQFMTPFQRRVG